MDENTAAQVVIVLSAVQQEELKDILKAKSIEDLTPAQRERLLQIVKAGAERLGNSEKPIG